MADYDIEENEEHEEEVPDSLLRRQGGRKFFDGKGVPFTLMGIGLVVLIIVFSWLMPESDDKAPVETIRPAGQSNLADINAQAMAEMESRMAEMETRMAHHQSQINERLDQLQSRLDAYETKVGKVDARLDELGARARNLASQVKAAEAPKPIAAAKSPKTQPVTSDRQYTVQTGDTLYSIARKHNISLSKLLELNEMGEAGVIHPGDKLRIAP